MQKPCIKSKPRRICARIEPHPTLSTCPIPLQIRPSSTLALNNRRARDNIARGNRPVQLELQPGIRRLISTGEGDQAARVERPGTAADSDLRARDVDLSAAEAGGRVQADVLDTQEVLAVG